MAERDSFIFYKEYKDVIDQLHDNKMKLDFYECITSYVFYNIIPNDISPTIRSMFILIKNDLDKRNLSYFNYEERRSYTYKKWKENVLERDNYTCQKCGTQSNLVVHHIIPFSQNKNLRFDTNNGITLCKECHRKEHKNER